MPTHFPPLAIFVCDLWLAEVATDSWLTHYLLQTPCGQQDWNNAIHGHATHDTLKVCPHFDITVLLSNFSSLKHEARYTYTNHKYLNTCIIASYCYHPHGTWSECILCVKGSNQGNSLTRPHVLFTHSPTDSLRWTPGHQHVYTPPAITTTLLSVEGLPDSNQGNSLTRPHVLFTHSPTDSLRWTPGHQRVYTPPAATTTLLLFYSLC